MYVDGEFKTSVKGTERTKALVEGVSASSVSVNSFILILPLSGLSISSYFKELFIFNCICIYLTEFL